MKKFFALLAVVLAVVSCQKDVDVDVNLGGDLATISVVLPEDAITRAEAAKETNSAWSGLQNLDGEELTVTLYIFDENGNPSKEPLRATLADGNLVANFDVRLVPGRNYTFVAWAGQNVEKPHFDITSTKQNEWIIALNDWAAMDESRDAFTGILPVQQFSSTKSIPTLELTRPFAKLRVVTTDMEWINNINVTPAYAEVTYTVNLPKTFNAFRETIGDEEFFVSKTHEFVIKNYSKDANGTKTLFTDYILVPKSGNVQFTLSVYEDAAKEKLIKTTPFVTDIPVKRNNLTTIKGNVLTDGNNITVEVKDEFGNGTNWNPGNDKYDVEVWDGKTIKQPTQDAEGNYIINKPSELAWLAAAVNGTLEETRGTVAAQDFAGKTFLLMNSIDLNNEAWTPVGQAGVATFNGVFDGQNYTISNLNVNSEAQTGEHYSSGLFGWVESHSAGHGHIKNVKIEGATIVGHHNCGALVGYITQETALVENCHVTGATVSCTKANNDADGDKAGALIGNATVATPVKNCTAANSAVSAGRDAGQVIGAGKEANVTGCSATNVAVSANGTGTGANVRNEVIGRLL